MPCTRRLLHTLGGVSGFSLGDQRDYASVGKDLSEYIRYNGAAFGAPQAVLMQRMEQMESEYIARMSMSKLDLKVA